MIFIHILESCKSGDAIPSSIPNSIIQSVGAEKEMEDKTVPCNYICYIKYIYIYLVYIK